MSSSIKQTLSESIFSKANYLILALFSLSIILPFVHIAALSFNSGADASAGGIYFWPRKFTMENYSEIFNNKAVSRAYLITVLKTIIGTFFSVLLTGMAAYGLKCKTLPGRKQIMAMLVFTMIFSGGTIPYYLLLKNLNLTKSFLIYIIPTLYSAWNLIIMKTFFESINIGMEEAAKIDGCNEFQIYFRIILPLSKPIVSVIALFNGVWQWNDWYTGAFYVRNDSILPVQTLLQKMLMDNQAMMKLLREGSVAAVQNSTRGITTQSLQMAMVVFCTVPIILAYPFIQKYFAQGFMVGSIKE